MKALLLLVFAFGITQCINAQAENLMKRKPWDEAKLKWLLRDTLNKINAIPNVQPVITKQVKNGVYHIPIKGVYIGENGKGDEIYAMQPDNMPCLVPGKNFASNMPVAGVDNLEKNKLPLLQKDGKEIPEVKLVP